MAILNTRSELTFCRPRNSDRNCMTLRHKSCASPAVSKGSEENRNFPRFEEANCRTPFFEQYQMAFLKILKALCLVLGTGNCYNLDTSHPIIYRAPEDAMGSYFGTSIAIRPRAAALNTSWAIQIGAPRGNALGDLALRPGTVYRCHLYGPCAQLRLDDGAGTVEGQGIYEYKQKKDGAWIGVSMDIVDFGAYERSVVCGHRWINENLKNSENVDVTYLMTGVCYLQDLFNGSSQTPMRKLLPLVNRDMIYTPKPYVVDLSTYHWGLGQAGFSVALVENASEVLIGAPGVTHWVGSVIRYANGLHATVGRFAGTEMARKSRYTYLGYAVAVGRFYKDREPWYVAGAPRSASYHGEGPSEDVRVRSNFVGATFGEYFGASLATADLNADSYDDLIVGAPLFSGNGADEGRIYVYLGTGRGNFLVPSQVVSGHASEGRFGFCVSSAKDLDGDGYADVAVGAPYEEGGGAVYVYGGYARGLRTQYSQRIRGQDVHPHLRGFGASISGAVDVDGNKYKDIAVGSYISGHVVLMRGRPVITLHPDIDTENASVLDRRDSHFNVTVCSRFAGSKAPEYVDVVRILDVDPVHGRAALDLKTSVYKKPIRLRRNGISCELLSVLLNLSKKNYSPLQITVRNEIGHCMSTKGSAVMVQGELAKGKDTFYKFCPVGAKAERTKEIVFAGVCGADLICRPDLEIFCTLPKFPPGWSYVLGSEDPLVLSIEVKNQGEPASRTRIKIWSDLKLKLHNHRPSDMANTPKRNFWIDLEGLLAESYTANFSFQIDLDSLWEKSRLSRLNFVVEIFTSSPEDNLRNNKCRLSLEITEYAHLDFYASSSPVSTYVIGKSARQILNVTHYYEVQKTGVTPLKDAELAIYIPLPRKTDFLSFEIETAEWMYLSDASEDVPLRDDETALSIETPGDRPLTNRTLFVNCSTPDNTCKIIKVFFPKGIPAGLSSYVKINLSLNLSVIGFTEIAEDIVHVSTEGVLRWWRFLNGEPRELKRSAAVRIHEQKRGGHVDTRVLGLSMLAGGFLLCLIVTGLAKRNFFERTKRQELLTQKDAEASFLYFATARNQTVASDSAENHSRVE